MLIILIVLNFKVLSYKILAGRGPLRLNPDANAAKQMTKTIEVFMLSKKI